MNLLKELLANQVSEEHEEHDHADDPNPISKVHGDKTDYEDSADFTGELHDAQQLLDKFDKIVSSAKFRNWMEVTDKNFLTNCVSARDDVEVALRALHDAWNDLGEELDQAQ